MSHSYDVGTRAWQPDATEGWVASEVVDKSIDGDKVKLTFKLENEEVHNPCSTDTTLKNNPKLIVCFSRPRKLWCL